MEYPKLRLLQGGKGPPDFPGEDRNWLVELELGTTFTCRNKNSKEVDLNLYHVVFKSLPGVVLLAWRLPDGKMLDYYVDPERFSKQFTNVTILGTQPVSNDENELEYERTEDNIDGDRSD